MYTESRSLTRACRLDVAYCPCDAHPQGSVGTLCLLGYAVLRSLHLCSSWGHMCLSYFLLLFLILNPHSRCSPCWRYSYLRYGTLRGSFATTRIASLSCPTPPPSKMVILATTSQNFQCLTTLTITTIFMTLICNGAFRISHELCLSRTTFCAQTNTCRKFGVNLRKFGGNQPS